MNPLTTFLLVSLGTYALTRKQGWDPHRAIAMGAGLSAVVLAAQGKTS